MVTEEKRITIKVDLSKSDYELLCSKAERRSLNRSDYIRYMIRNDQDDLRSKYAADALNMITQSLINMKEDKELIRDVKPYVSQIEQGVKKLWHCLR